MRGSPWTILSLVLAVACTPSPGTGGGDESGRGAESQRNDGARAGTMADAGTANDGAVIHDMSLSQDGNPPVDGSGSLDAAAPVDGMPLPPTGNDARPARDAQPPADMTPVRPDHSVLADLGQPDMGPLDGPLCDPRQLAAACEEPGHFCVPSPGGREDMGRCQPGDGCRPGIEGDCPAEQPYCHLRGGGTICTDFGLIENGSDCVDDLQIPRPCVAGAVCNNSVCQQPCVPGEEPTGCPEEGRCADISDTIGVEGGLCAPRNCNWFTGEGCEVGQMCRYAIRADGALVGACINVDGPGNPEGSPCAVEMDTCAQGLVCIGPQGRQRICRQLCDTGGYQALCGAGRQCVERLTTRRGLVRGYGLCITNE